MSLDKYRNEIRKLAENDTSGSEQLLTEALDVLDSLLSSPGISEKALSDLIAELSHSLRERFSGMSAIMRLASRLDSLRSGDERRSAKSFVEAIRRKLAKASESIAKIGANLIAENNTITTISQSGTVLSVLSFAKSQGKDFHVIALESDPDGEGLKTAGFLADKEIEVTLVPDAALGFAVEKSDLVLVGADAITRTFFVNKIGTLPLAICARYLSKPFFVCARLEKFISKDSLPKSSRVAIPKRLGNEGTGCIHTGAPLFERIPLSFVMGIITESGIVSPDNGCVEIERKRKC